MGLEGEDVGSRGRRWGQRGGGTVERMCVTKKGGLVTTGGTGLCEVTEGCKGRISGWKGTRRTNGS